MASLIDPNDKDLRLRKRRRSLLLVLGLGIVVFFAASTALYFALRPTTLRIAVGPPDSDDYKVVEAMVQTFANESRSVRLSAVAANGATEVIASLTNGKADLAVGRGDLSMPADAQTLAILRKNYAVVWTPSASTREGSKKKSVRKIAEIGDLEGHKVGVIGRTSANVELLRVILRESGVQADKVGISQFGTDKVDELAGDKTIDAFLAVGPLDSTITAQAIAATARARGTPEFLGIDASEAIALKHPRYEAEEIPQSTFNAKPAWPDDKIDTISVSHLIVTRKALPEGTAAAFFRELFAVREVIAQQVPGAAHITKPDTEKNTELPVHRGAAAVINGTERMFLDKYGDYFWFALLLLSGIGSTAAWLRRYLNRDERDETANHRNRILAATSEVRTAQSERELLPLQREIDAIIAETLECYDQSAIEQEDLAGFSLALELFDHAVSERRSALQTNADLSHSAVAGVNIGSPIRRL